MSLKEHAEAVTHPEGPEILTFVLKQDVHSEGNTDDIKHEEDAKEEEPASMCQVVTPEVHVCDQEHIIASVKSSATHQTRKIMDQRGIHNPKRNHDDQDRLIKRPALPRFTKVGFVHRLDSSLTLERVGFLDHATIVFAATGFLILLGSSLTGDGHGGALVLKTLEH